MAPSKFRYSYNLWNRKEQEESQNPERTTMSSNSIEMNSEDSPVITSSSPPPVETVEPVETMEDTIIDQRSEIETRQTPLRRLIGQPVQLLKFVPWSRMFTRSKSTTDVNDTKTLSSSSSGVGMDNENDEENNEPSMEESEILHLASSASTESIKIYAKILEEENSRLRQFVQEVLPASEKDDVNLSQDVIMMHHCTITDLENQIKALHALFEQVEENHRKEQEEMIKEHEKKLQELQRQSQIDLAKIVKDNQQLIDDILNSYFDEIHVWRIEFERDTKMTLGQEDDLTIVLDNVDTTVGAGQNNVALQLIIKFKELNPLTQGLVVAGIGIIGLVFGYYSWPFISWAWPRLLAFAARIEAAQVISVLTWLSVFTQSREFKEFKQAWEEGKPLTPVLIQNFGPDAFSSILQLAPSLFRKNRLPMAV